MVKKNQTLKSFQKTAVLLLFVLFAVVNSIQAQNCSVNAGVDAVVCFNLGGQKQA